MDNTVSGKGLAAAFLIGVPLLMLVCFGLPFVWFHPRETGEVLRFVGMLGVIVPWVLIYAWLFVVLPISAVLGGDGTFTGPTWLRGDWDVFFKGTFAALVVCMVGELIVRAS